MSARVQFSMRIDPACLDDELDFARKLGLDGVYTWVRDDQTDYESVQRVKDKVENWGLKLFTAHNYRLSKSPEVRLGFPGRDQLIDEFCEFLGALGKAGVPSTNFTWEPTYTLYWDHPETSLTRYATTRHVDAAEIAARSLLYDREYSIEEMWNNYEYFVKRVVPVAEQHRVGLALHPNDPPIAAGGGVAFLITSRRDYDRAFSVVDSPYLGMEFCSGCWLEGGDAFGDLAEGFSHFQSLGKVMVVHFRNVSSPLPEFHETHVDNGYVDLYPLAKKIVASGYSRSLILDHVPSMNTSYGDGCSLAYGLGYVKCLFDRAYDEVGSTKGDESS